MKKLRLFTALLLSVLMIFMMTGCGNLSHKKQVNYVKETHTGVLQSIEKREPSSGIESVSMISENLAILDIVEGQETSDWNSNVDMAMILYAMIADPLTSLIDTYETEVITTLYKAINLTFTGNEGLDTETTFFSRYNITNISLMGVEVVNGYTSIYIQCHIEFNATSMIPAFTQIAAFNIFYKDINDYGYEAAGIPFGEYNTDLSTKYTGFYAYYNVATSTSIRTTIHQANDYFGMGVNLGDKITTRNIDRAVELAIVKHCEDTYKTMFDYGKELEENNLANKVKDVVEEAVDVVLDLKNYLNLF